MGHASDKGSKHVRDKVGGGGPRMTSALNPTMGTPEQPTLHAHRWLRREMRSLRAAFTPAGLPLPILKIAEAEGAGTPGNKGAA
jgi:hypothetical protein